MAEGEWGWVFLLVPSSLFNLFDMAADPETNKFDVIPSQPQVKLGEERRTSWEKSDYKEYRRKVIWDRKSLVSHRTH